MSKTYSKPYFLSFVEEAVMNPDYVGFVGGRLEVYDQGPYAELEIGFFTDKRDEFHEFREKWDFMDVSAEELAEIEQEVHERFMERGEK